ncbi:YopX family protein [Clostridium sp. BJN0013]|uniref:YopX family protein n=1 Tax=Clostridium sp. BJN0013 TaxID=3236840 RepID=UPI0034C67374
MQREIKFRGIVIDNGKHVVEKNEFRKLLKNGEWATGQMFSNKGQFFIGWFGIWYEVNHETIGQYTGLKDKNNREIYEGDILQVFYGKENTPLTTTKVYFDEEGYWDSKNLSEKNPFKVCYAGFDKCEVIGNIYSNPELLKEGE